MVDECRCHDWVTQRPVVHAETTCRDPDCSCPWHNRRQEKFCRVHNAWLMGRPCMDPLDPTALALLTPPSSHVR